MRRNDPTQCGVSPDGITLNLNPTHYTLGLWRYLRIIRRFRGSSSRTRMGIAVRNAHFAFSSEPPYKSKCFNTRASGTNKHSNYSIWDLPCNSLGTWTLRGGYPSTGFNLTTHQHLLRGSLDLVSLLSNLGYRAHNGGY